MTDHLVDIRNLRLSFFTPAGEVKALNDVSLYLDEDEVLGIIGDLPHGKPVDIVKLNRVPERIRQGVDRAAEPVPVLSVRDPA